MPNHDRERALAIVDELMALTCTNPRTAERGPSRESREVWADALLAERDEAERAYIKALCVYCDTEGMPTLGGNGRWGHDWEGVTRHSRSRCESHIFYELRRRRDEGDSNG